MIISEGFFRDFALFKDTFGCQQHYFRPNFSRQHKKLRQNSRKTSNFDVKNTLFSILSFSASF